MSEAQIAPLLWTEPAPPDEFCPYDHVSSVSEFWVYRIEWKGWKDYDSYCVYGPGLFFYAGNDLDDAKVAAFRHVAKCVKLALAA